MSDMTTIKVPKVLRENVMRSARAEGLTAAEFLQLVTDEHARHRRFAAVRKAYAIAGLAGHDRDYDKLTEAWDTAVADGLDDPGDLDDA